MSWQKDGVDAGTLGRDLDECRQLARGQAALQSFPPGPSGPRIMGIDPQGNAILSSPGQIDTDRFLTEQDLARACMNRKGYKLVPAEER